MVLQTLLSELHLFYMSNCIMLKSLMFKHKNFEHDTIQIIEQIQLTEHGLKNHFNLNKINT